MNSKEPSVVDCSTVPAQAVLPFDAEKYLKHAEDFDLTEAQKTEFLRTLWDIMATFVRLGFGVESVLPALFESASRHAADGLEESIPTHEFNVAADEQPDEKEE